MFEITAVVADDDLAAAIHAIKDHCLRWHVQPSKGGFPTSDRGKFVNTPKGAGAGKPRTKKYAAQKPRNTMFGGSIKVIREALKTTGVSQVSARELRDIAVSKGYSKGSYSHPLKQLLKSGELKATDQPYIYSVSLTA